MSTTEKIPSFGLVEDPNAPKVKQETQAEASTETPAKTETAVAESIEKKSGSVRARFQRSYEGIKRAFTRKHHAAATKLNDYFDPEGKGIENLSIKEIAVDPFARSVEGGLSNMSNAINPENKDAEDLSFGEIFKNIKEFFKKRAAEKKRIQAERGEIETQLVELAKKADAEELVHIKDSIMSTINTTADFIKNAISGAKLKMARQNEEGNAAIAELKIKQLKEQIAKMEGQLHNAEAEKKASDKKQEILAAHLEKIEAKKGQMQEFDAKTKEIQMPAIEAEEEMQQAA